MPPVCRFCSLFFQLLCKVKQDFCLCLWIIRLHNCRHDADSSDSNALKDIHIVFIQSAYSVCGNGYGFADCVQRFSRGQNGLNLCRGRIDRTYSKIVRALLIGFQGLGDGLCRCADDEPVTQDFPMGISLCPRWTPSAPIARATSIRSSIISGT